ncbi:fimbrial protein [Acinetobacter sp. S40]|nr:fimbrial protein [Acinetobacter sp. S40]MBK0063582.1 fimbrial protein [Acinetobacter sp. S55]MBK0065347.1 fimbrial protein [Acinetobacter sp. S54]
MKNPKNVCWILLIVGSAFGHSVLAQSPVGSTSIKQSDYEPIHQGVVRVNAVVFNAPCNLDFKEKLMLTGCGAGNDYSQMLISDAAADTPAKLRFYDAQHHQSMATTPISLSNGTNTILMPSLMENQNSLRLEVSYE